MPILAPTLAKAKPLSFVAVLSYKTVRFLTKVYWDLTPGQGLEKGNIRKRKCEFAFALEKFRGIYVLNDILNFPSISYYV